MKKEMTDEDVIKLLNRRSTISRNTGCIEWVGCTDGPGYGNTRLTRYKGFYRKLWATHRLSYMVHIGEIPEGVFVCHRCDNPSCINPEHLFAGTHQDNMDDMSTKGRAKSTKNWGNNFASKKVYAAGVKYSSYSAAGRALGISDNGVRNRVARGMEGYELVD